MTTATWILDRSRTKSEQGVLLTLWELSELDSAMQISHSQIARRACMGKTSVYRSLKTLEKSGTITVTRGPNSSIPNTYRLNVENV